MQRVDNKIKGVAMLTVMTALAKVIGALYKIPLVGVLGAEGMGYYQAVFPLYAIVLTVVSSGVQTVAQFIPTSTTVPKTPSPHITAIPFFIPWMLPLSIT